MAKNRISLQIRYDRAGINPEMFELIKRDIIIPSQNMWSIDPTEVETVGREDHDKSCPDCEHPNPGIETSKSMAILENRDRE